MRKLVLAINVSLDGFADHTVAVAPDDEHHEFFSGLLDNTGIALFGRVTYELMAHAWPKISNDPSTTKSVREFAVKFNAIPKMVFSRTLGSADWNNTTLIRDDIVEAVRKLKQQDGKDLSIGGISVIRQLMKAGLIDEYWLVVHPVVVGKGRRLFEGLTDRINLTLVETRTFKSGMVALHYEKERE